jgi:hypothetical protein
LSPAHEPGDIRSNPLCFGITVSRECFEPLGNINWNVVKHELSPLVPLLEEVLDEA